MLQSYAVSILCEKPNGVLEHVLYVIEAGSIDAAEGSVMARSLQAGRVIRGMISRSCELGSAPAFAYPA